MADRYVCARVPRFAALLTEGYLPFVGPSHLLSPLYLVFRFIYLSGIDSGVPSHKPVSVLHCRAQITKKKGKTHTHKKNPTEIYLAEQYVPAGE